MTQTLPSASFRPYAISMSRTSIYLGTSSRPREGVGTLRSYRTINGATFVLVERTSGQKALLSLAPELAVQLLNQYGYLENETFISVQPLIGMRVLYKENRTGMLTELQPAMN